MILNEAKEMWVYDPVQQKHVQPRAVYLGSKLVWQRKQEDFEVIDMSIYSVLCATKKHLPKLSLIRTTI